MASSKLPVVIVREFGASLRAACWPLAGLQPLKPSTEPSLGPVVLVHGYLGHRNLLKPLAQRLMDEGYGPVSIVGYPSTRLGLGAIANRIGQTVEQARQSGPVRLIGHSLGAVACRYYLKRMGGAEHVDYFVSLGGPHAGTRWYWMCPPKLRQVLNPEGEIIRDLEKDDEPVPTTVVRARYDHQVFPPERARLDGVHEVLIHGHGHNGLLWAPEAHEAIISALRSA